MPSSVALITGTVQELLLEIEELRAREDIGRVMLHCNRPAAGTSFDPPLQQLLPIEGWNR